MGKINKKILLINPSYGKNDYSSMYTVPPLGIGYVGAYLKELGHEVRFCDFENTRIKEKEISDLIKNYDPDYVGIGGMTAHYLSAIKIFNIVKDIDNLIPTIYGGIHASAMPEYIMITNPSIDFIIVGEGELTFSELIKFNETDKDYYSEIDGLVWRKKGVGKVIMNRPREMIYNLDSLPNPWNILNPLDYQKGIVHSSIYKRMPTAPIITTRGCPYRSTYSCSLLANPSYNHIIHG